MDLLYQVAYVHGMKRMELFEFENSARFPGRVFRTAPGHPRRVGRLPEPSLILLGRPGVP
jgi:hypothetical protein